MLRRCVRGIFMTNITAGLAVMGSAWNPVMPIRSLAIFSGALIGSNFFFTLMILPATLVIYDKIEKACCAKVKKDDLAATEKE